MPVQTQHEFTYKIHRHGLVDDNIFEYELELMADGEPVSSITYRKDMNREVIVIGMVHTPTDYQGNGFAKKALEIFFKGLSNTRWPVCVESYTAAGEIKIRHVIEQMARYYNVRMVEC